MGRSVSAEAVSALWDAREEAFHRLHEANAAGLTAGAADAFMRDMAQFEDGMRALCRRVSPATVMVFVCGGGVWAQSRRGRVRRLP